MGYGALGGAWGVDPANCGFDCSFSSEHPVPPALVFTGGSDFIQPFSKVEQSVDFWSAQMFGSQKPAKIMSFNNRSTTCQSMSDNSGKRNITTCFSKTSFCATACTGRGIFACVGEA